MAREEEGSWSLPFKRHFQDSKFGSCDEIYGAHPQDENARLGEDSILLREEKKGTFRVKSFYNYVLDEKIVQKKFGALVPL